jgi:hypothetical protein
MTQRRTPLSLAAAFAVCLAAASLSGPSSAPAQGLQRVDLELALFVDVSQSMDNDEHMLQRHGYADAFRHEDVIDSIAYGAANGIAVAYVEWGDAYAQTVIVDWMLIRTREDALRFADLLDASRVYPERRTSISGALRNAATMIETNRFDGARRVIDISGDGPNNAGGIVTEARDEVVERGIVINGLPIMLHDALDWFDISELDKYYEHCVIGGPGSFIAPVRSMEELGATIRGKLVLEIASTWPKNPIVPVQFFMEGDERTERANCLIGEQMLGRGGRGFR